MKKIVLLLALIFVSQISCGVLPLWSANNNDASAIEKTIKQYIKALNDQSVNSVMKTISANYSAQDGVGGESGRLRDYEGLKAFVETKFNQNADISISDLKISEPEVNGDRATVTIEYKEEQFGLDMLIDKTLERSRRIGLAREAKGWKITSVIRLND